MGGATVGECDRFMARWEPDSRAVMAQPIRIGPWQRRKARRTLVAPSGPTGAPARGALLRLPRGSRGDPRRYASTEEWVEFLQWCLPRFGLQWRGFRRHWRRLSARLVRHFEQNHVHSLAEARQLIESNRDSLARWDRLFRWTRSRFFQDRGVYEHLRQGVLPFLATQKGPGEELRCWSVGCAAGEEVYSLSALWQLEQAWQSGPELRLLGTDVDESLLGFADRGEFAIDRMAEVPSAWRSRIFAAHEGESSSNAAGTVPIHSQLREGVMFRRQDVREETPEESFALILCRNLAFRGFHADLQQSVLERLIRCLEPGGFLVIGAHETLPTSAAERFREVGPGIFQHCSGPRYDAPSHLARWLASTDLAN